MPLKEQAISPILIAAALIGSLFFQGRNLYVFLAVQAALVCALTYQLIRAQKETLVVKVDLLSGTLLFFWLWLAVSFFLSRVPYISGLTFWWVGVLPMVYFICVVSPWTDDAWSELNLILLIVGLCLAVAGLHQFFVLQESPRGPFVYRNLLAAFLTMQVLISSGCFLTRKNAGIYRKYFTLCVIFLLVLTIGLTKSRGAMLCFSTGALSLLLCVYGRVDSKKDIFAILSIYVTAMLLAHFFSSGEVGSRILSLRDPYQAGGARFLIWEQSWNLWKDSPWYGNGLGTYWLTYAAYRLAYDANDSGFFAHNDYLQILTESGWPALLLLLAVLAAILVLFVKTYRNKTVGSSTKIESAGLFAALLSVFLHSIFDFDLYSMPTMILAGLVMGRLWMLCNEPISFVSLKVSPCKWFSLSAISLLLLLLALLPGIYFLTVGISHHYHQRGEHLIKAGQPDKAMDALQIAGSLWPSHDLPRYLQANIYQLALQENPQMDPAARKQAFDEAERKLRQAEKLNPLRPQTFVVRGQLYAQNRDLTGPDWHEKASRSFRQALAIDLRCYDARIQSAKMLLENGDVAGTAEVLKAGLKYWYPRDHRVLPYYQLAVSVFRQSGDSAMAEEAEKKIADIRDRYQEVLRESLKKPFE